MSKSLRRVIQNQLFNVKGEISNIIFNAIQGQMEYDLNTDKFWIELKNLRTDYFLQNPNERGGKIEGTDIYWRVQSNMFFVWLDM